MRSSNQRVRFQFVKRTRMPDHSLYQDQDQPGGSHREPDVEQQIVSPANRGVRPPQRKHAPDCEQNTKLGGPEAPYAIRNPYATVGAINPESANPDIKKKVPTASNT
jgi:hypothetical protein